LDVRKREEKGGKAKIVAATGEAMNQVAKQREGEGVRGKEGGRERPPFSSRTSLPPSPFLCGLTHKYQRSDRMTLEEGPKLLLHVFSTVRRVLEGRAEQGRIRIAFAAAQ
jgi:hypothetical protein